MTQNEEKNLKALHLELTQIYQDYLERLVRSGIDEANALGAANAFLNGDYSIDFSVSIKVTGLDVRCNINENELFNANLEFGGNTTAH